jgi:hypothetical protein
MTKSQLQISQVLWKITKEFCPRIIVINGRIQCVSTIDPSDFIFNKLWLPSSIKIICWKSVSENKNIQSVVIENKSQLEGIESEVFTKMALKFLAIPNSVRFLAKRCFYECKSLSSIGFESGSRLS